MSDTPVHFRDMFARDAPLTQAQIDEYIAWLQLHRGYREILATSERKNMVKSNLRVEIRDDIAFIIIFGIDKIKAILGEILTLIEYADSAWWRYFFPSNYFHELVDFIFEKRAINACQFDIDLIVDHFEKLAYIEAKNLEYNLNFCYIDLKWNNTTILCRNLVAYYNITRTAMRENAELRAEITELRLRPPELGGPDYEAAKLRFTTAQMRQ